MLESKQYHAYERLQTVKHCKSEALLWLLLLLLFQIFDEEYNVWFLDWGGALVAMKHTPLPVRHLW